MDSKMFPFGTLDVETGVMGACGLPTGWLRAYNHGFHYRYPVGKNARYGLLYDHHFIATKESGVRIYIHVWYGRFLTILGIVNEGLGLQLAGNPEAGTIVYGVVAGLVGVAYFTKVVLFKNAKRSLKNDIVVEVRSRKYPIRNRRE
ncbi:hypothetical protein PAAG_05542 [Paracoccidioides lutzii Pb01]|uniref:Uncharacterized protein n=1 Tax=Paracoccidioides lutzii (strain ATCC MYA-826 / Pb01) TaxID=502779 RepID=C1H449_PARBA|nr:hypothetical protein PAAG_05542 [Paracoccidioides lutzii Pb01]EEH34493.2 hypothetical protein PAAG_05542 [Paracoccidioides lutzii Pb01]